MKKRVFLALFSVLLSIIITIAIFQFVFPLSISFDEAKTYIYLDGTGTEYNEAKEGLLSDIQLLTTKDFDLSNPYNFRHVVLWYEVKNRSFLDIWNIEFFVEDVGEYIDCFMYKSDAVVSQSADAFESSTIRFDIYMYTEGLSESQILQAVKGLTVSIQYNQKFTGNHTKSVTIPDNLTFADNLIFDENGNELK